MATGKTPLLHEILAVEQDLKGAAERSRTATLETFRVRQTQFTGIRRTFRPFSVDEDAHESAGERLEAETKLAKTVVAELAQMFKAVGTALNAGYQIDEGNTRAKADVVVDNIVILKDVPATFLLQLERRLREIRAVLKEAPCFDPVRTWTTDIDADRKSVLKADPVVTIRKSRTRKYNIMCEATKEHPAQVDIVEIDQPVGEIRSYEWTGKLSTAKRSALLERVDVFTSAVKQARSRANTVNVTKEIQIGKIICDFLQAPIQS